MKPANILDITRNRSIAVSHRCSVCGYTVINLCTVTSLVRAGYDFSAAKAMAHAEETAVSEMDALVADIASCREKPHSLAMLCPNSPTNPWSGINEMEIDSKTLSMTRISALTDACPFCGNKEPWQKIGTQAGSSALEAIQKDKAYDSFKDNVKEYKDYDAAMMDMKAGRIDVVAIDEVYAIYNNKNKTKLYESKYNFGADNYAIGFRKGDEALAKKINEALQKTVDDGQAAKISKKWFGKNLVKIGANK